MTYFVVYGGVAIILGCLTWFVIPNETAQTFVGYGSFLAMIMLDGYHQSQKRERYWRENDDR